MTLTALVASVAIARLISGAREVHGLSVLIVSTIAALAMVAGALILGDDEDDDNDEGGSLNMRAVLLDTAADAAAAATVAVTGGIILATSGNYWLDPTVALAVSAVVAYHSIKLLRRVIAELGSGPRSVT